MERRGKEGVGRYWEMVSRDEKIVAEQKKGVEVEPCSN